MRIDITEYIDTSHGNLIDPPVACQMIECDGPTRSQPFNKLTRAVRIQADVNSRIAIGTNPEAPKFPITGGVPLQRVVAPGEGFRVFAIPANPDDRSASGTVDGLIALITDAKAAAKRKAELEKLEAKTAKATEALRRDEATLAGKLEAHTSAAAELAKQQAEFTAFFTEHDADLAKREAALKAAREAFEAETGTHVAAMKRREDDVTRREDALVEATAELQKQQREVAALKADLERRLAHFKAAAD
jgi:hypothetical protein